MKLVIFAGGHGTRLWPLSRKNSPKQFEKIFNGKSTLQLAFDRVAPEFGAENIYISSNEKYKNIILEQLPRLPESNFLSEPDRRDLAPAVGLSLMKFKSEGYTGPVAILWSDHLMDNVDEFVNALKTGEELIKENPNRFVYMGEKPRFANHNLGWISIEEKIAERNGLQVASFKSWVYRPPLELCKELFASGKAFWNPGYFVTSVSFVLDLYAKYMSEMLSELEKMVGNPELTSQNYKKLEAISFDDAILAKTQPSDAVVLLVNFGWSDPGTLYALKEALVDDEDDNLLQGNVFDMDNTDTLVINREEKKLVAAVGLDGMLVINTPDALLVIHKDEVPKIKEIVAKLESEGKEEYI